MNKTYRLYLLILLAVLALVLTGCERPSTPGGTSVWIDVPVDGITVPEGQMLQIEGHASSPGGVSKIEIWINANLAFEIDNPPAQDDLSRYSQEWTPPGSGEYTIQVLALSEDGTASEPDNARIQVGEQVAALPELFVEFPEPDLTITGVSLVGDDKVQCDYSNLGGAVLPEGRDVYIEIYIGSSEAELVQISYANIGVDRLFEAGDSGYLTTSSISPAPVWPQLAYCSIDVGDLVAESDEGNNDMQRALGASTTFQNPEPDLTITDVSLVGDDVVQCDYGNLGAATFPEGREVWIDIHIGPSEAEFVQIAHSNIGVDHLFEAGDSGYFTSAPISPAPAWPQLASCSIDVGNLVAESNEGNNDMQATLGSHLAIQGATVRFWADPGEINAGGKFTIHWQAENVRQVIFGGKEQPFEGSYSDYLCKNERYTLTVIHNDGSEEKHSVDIIVNGQCEAPEEESEESQQPSQPESSSGGEAPASEVDNTAPPAPNQLKPVNGVDLGCIGSAMLRWDAVSDPSGIAEYQVEMQRHAGDNNWGSAPGSVFTGIGGGQKEISVECGWEYRWRVRAIDGEGNVGNWSGWFSFNIPLT